MSNLGHKTYKVLYAGICGSDLQKTTNNSISDIKRMGHEIVARTNEGLAVINPMISCKQCSQCINQGEMFCENLHALGRSSGGAFSGEISVPDSNVIAIDYLDPKLGVLADPLAVVIHGAKKIKSAQDILILGDGTIAQLSLLYSAILAESPRSYTLVAKSAERAKIMQQQFEALLKSSQHKIQVTSQIEPDATFDTIIECVGRGQSSTLNKAIEHVAIGGCILSYGVYPISYKADIDIRSLLYKEAMLVGSNSYDHSDLVNATQIIGDNENMFSPFLGQTFKDLSSAFAAARDKSSTPKKIVISFGE